MWSLPALCLPSCPASQPTFGIDGALFFPACAGSEWQTALSSTSVLIPQINID